MLCACHREIFMTISFSFQIAPIERKMGFVQTLLYCFMATSLLPRVALQNCRDPVFIEMSLQERLYQAEIIVYGQDQLSFSPCPQEEDSCKTTPRNEREYSNFMVYCVVKNNGPPIPANMTIYPKTFGDPCTETRFEQGVEGWVYLVTLSYKDGKYYWDEINGMSALTTIYIVDNDEKLKRAGNVCNLPPASLPEGYSEVKYCPATLNRTRDENTCFQGKRCVQVIYLYLFYSLSHKTGTNFRFNS